MLNSTNTAFNYLPFKGTIRMTEQAGIYKITNTVNNHSYIGSSNNIKRRWNKHKQDLHNLKHHSTYLQHAWSLYAPSSFLFSVLLYCEDKDLTFYEQRAIDAYKPEYNICLVANSTLGRVVSEATRQKLSSFNTGKVLTREHKDKISKSEIGKLVSDDTKAKISSALSGRSCSEKHKENISKATKGVNNPFFGKKHSEETKLKISLTKRKS